MAWMHVDDGTGTNHNMLSVDYRPRQELLMQTGGSSVTRKLRLLRNWNILIVSISSIACFAGHRTIYRNDLRSMDVAYRRFQIKFRT